MAQYRRNGEQCNASEIEQQFSEVLARDIGFIIEPIVVADGKAHRFDIEKKGDRLGYYQLWADGKPHGLYGRWDQHGQGAWLRWQPEGIITETPEGKAARRKAIEANKRKREAERQEKEVAAAQRASEIWEKASQCSAHPYLEKKGVGAYGVRVSGDDLVIPIRNSNKELKTLQFIAPDGQKHFLSGGAIRGNYHVIPGTFEKVYIVEGYATGASVHEATGACVVVALNAGNLEPVARDIRAKADTTLIIAGDHDKSGTGQKKGAAAAKVIGARFIMPPEPGDWNDYHQRHGLEATKAALEGTPEPDDDGEPVNVEPETDPKSERPEFSDCVLPDNYEVTEHGLCTVSVKEKEVEGEDGEMKTEKKVNRDYITFTPLWPVAHARTEYGEDWGLLIRWLDRDERLHSWSLPRRLLAEDGKAVIAELSRCGCAIHPRKTSMLLTFLGECDPEERLIAISQPGWHKNVYALPDRIIGDNPEHYIYQPESDMRQITEVIKTGGTFEDWKRLIEDVAPAVRFAIAAALAAPLLTPTQTQSGGIHFYGQTSRGKTTLLQAAASVWGAAGDPGIVGGANTYIRRWNSTAVGFEMMAAAHKDLPLIVDEVGEADSHSFARIIYQIFSGTGRARGTKTGGMARLKSWMTLLLSAGEMPVSRFIEDAKGGHLVRLLDIPVDQPPIFSSAAEADRIKTGMAQHYGWAGPAFLEAGGLLDGWDEMTPGKIGPAPSPEASRVRDRMRLIAHAGENAIKKGILPWRPGSVLAAVQQVYNIWLRENVSVDEGERGLSCLRSWLLSNRHRLADEQNPRPINPAGMVDDDYFYIYRKEFAEACQPVDERIVRRKLKELDLLHHKPGRLTTQISVHGVKATVLAIKKQVLEGDEIPLDTGPSITEDISSTSIESIERPDEVPF